MDRPKGDLFWHLKPGDSLEIEQISPGPVRFTLEGKAEGRGNRQTVRLQLPPGTGVRYVKGKADGSP